jgi:phage terminase large subunit-like protein
MPFTKKEQLDEIMQCGSDPVYFIRKYLYIQHPMKGRLPFDLFPFQEECIGAFLAYKHNIVLKSRQLGLSTTTAAYCLWLAMFKQDTEILIMATKLEVSKNIITKIRTGFKMLPKWMLTLLDLEVPEAESVKYIKFNNGSRITATPTSEDVGRSSSLSLLVIDECVSHDTYVTVRNKITGEIHVEAIGNLLSSDKYH